jgi:hypothetical protein
MAISDSQKVDLLWKKVGFGKVKTDSNANKKAPNEAIASDFIIKANQIWNQSSSIPNTIPSSSSGVVTVYSDANNNSVETTEDATASDNRTWKAGTTNWIPPSFGATYQLKVYAASSGEASPQTNGTQLFETGSGNDDQWYFDYQSGTLHFIGTNLPTAIATSGSNVIHIVGARYSGSLGVGDSSASQTFIKTNLTAVYSDATIATGDIIKVDSDADGEYAVYISNQDNPTQLSHLTLISTRDSAEADAQTLKVTATYNGGNVTLGNVSATSRPAHVSVTVDTAFDGSTTMNIGDDGDNSRLMADSYIDLSTTGTYTVSPSYVYSGVDSDANNTIKAYVVAGTSTQGSATVVVTYS